MMDRSRSRPSSVKPLFRKPLAQGPSPVLVRLAYAALIATVCVTPSRAATPSAAKALSLKPLQKDATYESVPADLVAKCKVADIVEKGLGGWEITGPDGGLLRRFVDTNGDKRIDLWSYFNYGIEAYRDIDSDFNGKADQYRWLGNSGTRWGIDRDEDGKIEAWKRISAEEVSAEVVAALRDSDPQRFASLLASASELKSLGLGEGKLAELEMKSELAAKEFTALAKSQKTVGAKAEWIQFAAPAPGLVPSGTDGSIKDVLVYENVVAMFENGGQSGQLMVGTLVQIGDRWRMVGLPNVGSVDGTMTQSAGLFFTPGEAGAGAMSQQADAGLQVFVTQLEALDKKLASTDEKELPQLHAARADLVEKLIAGSGSEEDRATWTRQLVDTVAVAVQSGQYPDGLDRLKRAAGKFARQNVALAAYVDYQAIQAEYVVRQTPDADFEKVQNWYLESLADFVDKHPRTLESAQAMLQLALSKEFEDKETEALAFYKKVRDGYKGTDPGEKAAGAVRRLESVGRRIELEGTTIGGKAFRLSELRGRPVVIHYWATWCVPCKQDMKLLSQLQGRYKADGLTLVGINVDAQRSDVEAYLRENRLTWTQLFEDGGLESSRLSTAFGVQTLPTMMLIDKTGTVVRHNVRASELADEIGKLVK